MGEPSRGRPLDARGRRFAIVASRFNEDVTRRLLVSALACLVQHGATEEDIRTVWVPGAVEIPLAAQRLARAGGVDAVIALGAVIRGGTAHYEHVSRMVADGILRVGLDTGVPVIFGVLTTDSREQALERARGEAGDKGWDAARAAIEMALFGEPA